MTNYGWAGPGEMREIGLHRAEPPKTSKPAGVQEPDQRRLFKCTECARKFPKAMIMARHFNGSHEELREDSDSWREHYDEVWE